MPGPGQQIQFARARDDVRIAYALTGQGYPVVRAAHWLGHLGFDWQTPIWRPWIDALTRQHALLRYDCRGCGLSDHDVEPITLDGLVSDLEAAVDAAGLDRPDEDGRIFDARGGLPVAPRVARPMLGIVHRTAAQRLPAPDARRRVPIAVMADLPCRVVDAPWLNPFDRRSWHPRRRRRRRAAIRWRR